MKSTKRERQIRLTFEDTMRAQSELRAMIWKKYRDNDFIHYPEQKTYIELLNKSFLSNGNWRIAFYEQGNLKIPLGPVHTLCLQMAFTFGHKVKLKRYEFEKDIDIKEIWKIVLDEMPFIFVAALEESLKTSAETPRGEERAAFDWSHERGFK